MKIPIKIIFTLYILELTTIKCLSQDWPKVFGDDIRAYGEELLEQYDQGYHICGSILRDASHFKYGWLIKTDINGNVLWDKKFGEGNRENFFLDFDQTSDQGLIISGATAQYDIEIDPLFIKLDLCGDIEWCKIFLSEGFNTSTGIIPLPTGEYLGMLQYYGGDYQNIRISLVKMDSNGEPMWIQNLAQEDSIIVNEEGYNLYLTNDSNYLVTGTCFCPSKKPFFIKTDTAGMQLWDIRWPTGYEGFANRSVFADNGTIYTATGLSFPDLPRIPYLLKFNENGDVIDQYPVMGDTIERGGAKSLLLFDDTTMYVGLTWTDDPFYYEGHTDILKTDTLGNMLTQRRLIDDEFPPTSIIKSFDSKIVTIGTFFVDGNTDIYMWKMNENLEDDTLYTHPMTYDSLCPYEIQSDTILLDCGLIVNINEIPSKEEYESTIKISPNPARDWVMLTLPDVASPGEIELAVYNTFGQEVMKKNFMAAHRMIALNVSNVTSGLYLAVTKDLKNRFFKGKFVIAR
jgi:hypothetical protein